VRGISWPIWYALCTLRDQSLVFMSRLGLSGFADSAVELIETDFCWDVGAPRGDLLPGCSTFKTSLLPVIHMTSTLILYESPK
jgi:hypothetical protein